MVIATSADGTFLFWSRFSEALDDYVEHYEVWRMPRLTAADLSGSWETLQLRALERMPDIPLRSLPFSVARIGAVGNDSGRNQ